MKKNSESAAEARENFEKYDWANSEEWGSFWDSLYPVPPANKVLRWKEKWFKRTIDDKLDLTEDSKTRSSPMKSGTPTRAAPTSSAGMPSHSSGPAGVQDWILFSVHTLALLAAFFAVIPFGPSNAPRYSVTIFILAAVLEILIKFSPVQFRRQWFQTVFLSEEGQMLCMAATTAGAGFNTLGIISPFISSVLFFSHHYMKVEGTLPLFLKQAWMRDVVVAVNNSNSSLMMYRSNFEVTSGIVAIGFYFIKRQTSVFALILYWSTLRIKYRTNAMTRNTFSNMHEMITKRLASPSLPSFLLQVYLLLSEKIHNFA